MCAHLVRVRQPPTSLCTNNLQLPHITSNYVMVAMVIMIATVAMVMVVMAVMVVVVNMMVRTGLTSKLDFRGR